MRKQHNEFNGNRKTITEILKVSISNIAILLSGVLVGFLLPRVIGVTDYGYYKTYTLYATYIGMFHFGIVDGIYLKYGGKEYKDLKKEKFRFYSAAFASIELCIAAILVIISLNFFEEELQYIFVFLSIYLLFHNITSYYQSISQATSRFTELSWRNIIQSILVSVSVISLWIVHKSYNIYITYKTYIVIYTVIVIVLTIWYVFTYREITFGKKSEFSSLWRDIPIFAVSGFPLMVANLCSSLILTLDRQFVNLLFDTDTYAIYAFAYNMLSLITTAMSAIATVLYPKLKRTDGKTLHNSYTKLINTVLVLVFGGMLIYFPLALFVNWFLPKYSESLIIFRIIFPGLAISSAITIVMHNYYKALGLNFTFFIKSIIVLLVSGVANFLAYHMFHTTAAISIASIVTMLFWYVLIEIYFIRKYNVKWLKNFIYLVLLMSLFYIITIIKNYYLGFIIYGATFICITLLFNIKEIQVLRK